MEGPFPSSRTVWYTRSGYLRPDGFAAEDTACDGGSWAKAAAGAKPSSRPTTRDTATAERLTATDEARRNGMVRLG